MGHTCLQAQAIQGIQGHRPLIKQLNMQDFSGTDVLKAMPFVAATGAAAFFAYKAITMKGSSGCVNQSVQKNDAKVVHSFKVDDLGDQAVFCRCWRSSKFPYCDGSHVKHNETTGDNVGPLIVKKKE